MISKILRSLKYSIYLSVSWFVLQKVNVSSFQDGQNLNPDSSQSLLNNHSMKTISGSDDIVKSLENMVQQLSGTPKNTTLVAVNENEVEKYSANSNPAILIPEPDTRPAQLIFEEETVDPTVLMLDQDLPSRTLLVSEPTEPESTVLFREPEYKKPSVVYMEPENEFPPEIQKKMRLKAITRLIEEPEDTKTKASLCSEPIEYPTETPNAETQKNKVSDQTDSEDDSDEDDSDSEKESKDSKKETNSDSGMSDFDKLFAGITMS